MKKPNNTIKIWVEDLNKLSSKEDIYMFKKYMKICSTSLIIRKMQTKTMMRYHLTPVRMAIIKKCTYNLSQKESNWLHIFCLPKFTTCCLLSTLSPIYSMYSLLLSENFLFNV